MNQDKGNIVAVLGNLNKEQARRPPYMRKVMIKLAKVAKKFEELLNEPVQDSVLRGILTNMCDKETKAYITPYAHESYKAFKKRIEEFMNSNSHHSVDAMDIGAIDGLSESEDGEPEEASTSDYGDTAAGRRQLDR